jgi:hypothetical protein
MEFNREKLHAELREVLKCPVNWEDFFSSHVLIDHLYALWLAAVQQFPEQIRNEGNLVNELVMPTEDLVELEWDLHNLKNWINKARTLYLQHVVLFHRIAILDGDGRGKHWPHPSWTRDQIIARSNRKETGSIFFHSMKPARLQSALQSIMGMKLVEFMQAPKKYYYVDFQEEIGASKRTPTTTVCFEIDPSTPNCHAYPVSEEEVKDTTNYFVVTSSNRELYVNPPRAGDIYLQE